MTTNFSDDEEHGLVVLGKMLGGDFSQSIKGRVERGGIGACTVQYALGTTFARVWGREGLDWRSRSLVTIALLIATRSDKELRKHFRIGKRNGLTVKELEEVVFHTLPYLGHTCAAPAMEILAEVFGEED